MKRGEPVLTPEEAASIAIEPHLTDFPSLKTVDLHDVLMALEGGGNGTAVWKRQRGYGLEKVVHEALLRDGLEARSSTPASRGDQIDGALVLDGRAAVVECKWEASAISSTKLTAFQAKVDRRLVGTIGFFISASGFAEGSHSYLQRASALNTLLVDFDDLKWALSPGGSIGKMLREKILRAAWDGLVYWRDPTITSALAVAREGDGIVIVTQGPSDEEMLTKFVRTMEQALGRPHGIPVVAAYGVFQANALAKAISTEAPKGTKVLAVVDGDSLSTQEVEKFWKDETPGVEVIVAHPTIESWFSSQNIFDIPEVRVLHSRLFSGGAPESLDLKLIRKLQREIAF
jgi:hypothetical protein